MGKDGELVFLYQSKVNKRILRSTNINGELKVDSCFTILPNVDGQKYTLGMTFTGREAQGEFIFLDHKSEANVGSNYCEIIVKKGQYFASSIDKGPEILINSKKLARETRLNFGDILSINGLREFLFREREFNSECIPQSEDVPLLRGPESRLLPEILSIILSHLTVPDLKLARLVSSTWNEEGFKLLRKQSILVFDFSTFHHNPDHSMRLFRHSVEMQHTFMPHWKVELPTFGPNQFGSTVRSSDPKLFADLDNYLFQGRHETIETLELGGTICNKMEWDLHTKTLTALGGSNLQRLHLNMDWQLKEEPDWDIKLPNTHFPNLTRFKISMTDFQPIPGHGTTKFLEIWAPRVTNVTKLTLRMVSHYSKVFLKRMAPISHSFLNLNAIVLQEVNPGLLRVLLCLNLVLPLVKLGLLRVQNMERKDFPDFEEVLSKYSKTLTHLHFSGFKEWGFSDDESEEDDDEGEDQSPITIHLPKFPKLRHLVIGWAADQIEDSIQLRLAFPGDEGINYAKHLPALVSLTLWPVEVREHPDIWWGVWFDFVEVDIKMEQFWRMCGRFYETFFPQIAPSYGGQGQICQSLKILNVINKLPKCCKDQRPVFGEDLVSRISAMFPNVCNPVWD